MSDKNKYMCNFNDTNDKSMQIEKLKMVYTKEYIRTQFIFIDDTIKEIKNKICCSIKNNDKFGENPYIIPSRQYLWSEYIYNDDINKIMLGQKWLRRNELLEIDVEPDTRLYYYEQLRDKLLDLKNIIRKVGARSKREDEENKLLVDYNDYITFNEIYMIDIYNELGKNYSPSQDTIKNLEDLYFKVYFPNIKKDEIINIVNYLNNKTDIENNKNKIVFDTLYNDMIIQNEVVNVVENVKRNEKYIHLFKENYVTHSVLHINLRIIKNKKLDMYRIFNEFITDSNFPYIQYQTLDSGNDYKYNIDEIQNYSKDTENSQFLYKWFETGYYGLSFKIKIEKKSGLNNKHSFLSVNINEIGRVEYKINWQEEEKATIDDIKDTYKYVKDLITKINTDSPRNKMIVPEDIEFKFAFINTISKFDLPEKFKIDHNDLREFSRLFYPYISLIIDPKKRMSKKNIDNDKSKYGTYLRSKKVSNYDNINKLEHRIMYFFKQYEFSESKLITEISREFNITEERTRKEIDRVRLKYPNIKKSIKILKTLDKPPKFKADGIGIDIQGKQRENYKIRISGARNREQLFRIIDFINILIHLYIDTYLYKKKDRQKLKETLIKLRFYHIDQWFSTGVP